MNYGNCPKRAKESAPLNDKTKTLVLINHFPTIPVKRTSCKHNSKELMDMLGTCYVEAGDRWANFIAVDYFEVYLTTTSNISCHSQIRTIHYLLNVFGKRREAMVEEHFRLWIWLMENYCVAGRTFISVR